MRSGINKQLIVSLRINSVRAAGL